MGTKESIKKGLISAGTSYTVKRLSGGVSGEYLDFEPNAQVTKPFIREFFIETLMPYDTTIRLGDVVKFDATGDYYLAMHKTASILKNAIILNDGVFYRANVSGELLRPSGEGSFNSDYRQTTSWEIISGETGSVCYALQTEPLHGIELQSGQELGDIGSSMKQFPDHCRGLSQN